MALTLFPAEVLADTDGWGEPVVQIDNGVIKVTADKQTGRFIAETVSGIPNKVSDDNQDLLYASRFEGPETSYTSVRIDGKDFIYGNSYGFLGMEGHYVTAPYIDYETNSIVSEWSIMSTVIRQTLTLKTNAKLPSIGNIYVSYEIVNKADTAKSVGIRMLLDTKIGTVDSPALTVPGGGFIYKETEYIGDEIPSVWYAYNQYITPQIIAVGGVSGEGLTKPDKLQFAAWGDVSQTRWDYTVDTGKAIIEVLVDGLPYDGANGTYPDNSTVIYSSMDSSAVMYWNPAELAPGEKKTISTAYGVGDASEKQESPSYSISLQGTDKLNMKQDKSGYTVDYVNAEFNIDNNYDNSTNIANAQIELVLPDELELVEGQEKTVLSSITKGDYYRSIWKVRPKIQYKYTVSAYSVIFRSEGKQTQRITKILIMEGKESGMPEVTFLDYAQKTPFYVHDKFRTVSVNGSGFSLFGSALGQLMTVKLVKGNQSFTVDPESLHYTSDSVFSITIPDGLPMGNYDLYVSAAPATENKKDEKTFRNAIAISDDIKYSHNLVNEIVFPVVMTDDGINTPEETITIKGIFIDNGDGTYTSLGADLSNPVIINNTLKYAGGTLRVNTNSKTASLSADDGTLWCDIIDENRKSYTQAVIAKIGFEFETFSEIGDEDTKVRMVYDLEKPGANYTNDVSYKNIPIKIQKVVLTQTGIEINGSMGILNPLTYLTNSVPPNEDVDALLGTLGIGYCQAELGTVSLDSDGMNIDGKFAFQMPFVMSLFSGTDAVLELNTREEHVAVEIGVSIGNFLPMSAGAKARVGFRRGRFDEIYVGGTFPQAIEIIPPIPIGISGFSGGLKNLSFKGALPITVVMGLSLSDTLEAMSIQSYNLLSIEGEAEVSPFHYISDASASIYMMEIGSVSQKFVWWTLDPSIEKRGIRVEGTIIYYVFEGNVVISYFEGEGFLGRGSLKVIVPEIVPIFGGLVLAGVGTEITEYSIAGMAEALGMDVGIRYYFRTNKVEFLELKEELEKAENGIITQYSDGFIAEYGCNFVPMQFTQHADADSQYIAELNLTQNSNAMIVLRMTQSQFNSLNEDSIKVVKPGGQIMKVKYIDNTDLVDSQGNIVDINKDGYDIVAVKQVIDMTSEGIQEIEYMVTLPLVSPEDGQWTFITKGAVEIMPYSSMAAPEITSLSSSYNSDGSITANWVLNGEPDKFRFYIVNAEQVDEAALSNPAKLWGTGNLLYGQKMKYKQVPDPADPSKTIEIEDEITYIAPTKDGEPGTFTTEKLNLPTGSYYIYAKAEKENTAAAYRLSELEITNPATPEPPEDLRIEDIGDNQIRISWEADYRMSRYFIYRKNSPDEKYETGSPYAVYEVDKDGDILDRFEVIVTGDELDLENPSAKDYYFDVRAVGNKTVQLAASLQNASLKPGETIGSPAEGSLKLSVPEKINLYSEIKSADDKMTQKPYVEKDTDGNEQQYYRYVTKSPNAVISCSSEKPVKYRITQNGAELPVSVEGFISDFSENITLNDGINYFIITYENEGGDSLTEEYTVELDNKAPALVIMEPEEGAIASAGKITVSGTTEPYINVSVNNVNYDSDVNGNFSAEVDLGTSFNSKITVEVRDTAGNITGKELSVLNDAAEITDISVVPEYKTMTTGMTQKLSTYASKDETLGEKLPNNLVKYTVIQGSDLASVNDDGILTGRYEGTVIVKSEIFLTDKASISDSIAIEITGDKKPGGSKYYPPVYSRKGFTWLAGSAMSTRGGTIRTDDGVILEIPDGAIPYYMDNVDIYAFNDIQGFIEQLNIPGGARAASNPYFISLLSDLLKPARLTLPVTEGGAYIYYFDEETGALIYRGGKMSSDNRTVAAGIMRPGAYIGIYNPSQDIFADVADDFWAYDYIYGLNFMNIINGYSDAGKLIFRPAANITRAEFVKLLVSANNINLADAEGIELKFADTDTIPEWAMPYVKAAVMNGLVSGKNIGNKNYFAAGDYITREEIAAIIGRSIDLKERSSISFSDYGQISEWARDEVLKLIATGIISGYEDNTFRPLNNATRAEASAMIYRYLILLRQ